MNSLGITDKSYQHLINAISNYPEIEQVLVFGSRAKGNYKNGSDVDLAIKGKHCNDAIVLNLSALLNEALPVPYKFDVVLYDGISHAPLKQHIDRVGKIFYDQNKQVVLVEVGGD